jgi:oligopeptide transport system permease protein
MNTKFAMYIVKRLLLSILTIFIVITITFFAMQAIPGGPFTSEKSVSDSVLAVLKAKYGLDKPLYVQYWNYLKNAVMFDYGPSMKQKGQDVIKIIQDGFAVSGKIGAIAALIALFFGVILGSYAATHQNKWVDRVIMIFSTASVAMPSFIIATFLLLLFCVKLKWLPANGTTVAGYVLPVICLSLYPMAYITRLTRTSTLDVLGQDYIRTAKAKGVSKTKILFKHGLRNSLTPVITYFGPMFAYIITGSLVVEQIFGIPGLGRPFITAITGRDYTLIMGTTIFLTVIMVVMLLISDILYKIANPRVSFD